MLFNIWKTWWLSAQILPRGCWAWARNRVAVRLTVRSLSEANTLFIRPSVCLSVYLTVKLSPLGKQRPEPSVNKRAAGRPGGFTWACCFSPVSPVVTLASFKWITLGCSWSGRLTPPPLHPLLFPSFFFTPVSKLWVIFVMRLATGCLNCINFTPCAVAGEDSDGLNTRLKEGPDDHTGWSEDQGKSAQSYNTSWPCSEQSM